MMNVKLTDRASQYLVCTRGTPSVRHNHAVFAHSGRTVQRVPVQQTHKHQHTQRRRYVATAAASSDDIEPIIDVEASLVISSSAGTSSSITPARASSSSSESPLDDIAETASGAVDDTSDVAAELATDAANAASTVVSDAANAASTVVSDAANAASAVVSDASDVGAAAIGDATDAASAAVASAQQAAENTASAVAAAAAGIAGSEPGPAIDWSAPSGQQPDQRFGGMKVLVVGATGGVGRRVVEALRAKGVACRALVRDKARAANLLPPPTTQTTADSLAGSSATPAAPEFDIVKGDVYKYATLPSAFAGCNAVVVASAANDKSDPFGPFNVDFNGTLNLIAAAKRAGVKRFVFVTSIGADDPFNPLNLFWGILFWKKRAEEELQRSGLAYTIVRPGGLKSRLGSGEVEGNVVMEGPNSFGFPPFKRSGSILRSQVADVCVEALVCPAAGDKVVEVIAEKSAPQRSLALLFEGVAM